MVINSIAVRIKRFRPGLEKPQWEETFTVPAEKKITVLQALQFIYENLDPTLAFEYSCRYGKCGLCGMEINGRPVLACTTFVKKDEVIVAPMANLITLRDLTVDRRPIENLLQEQEIYYKGKSDNGVVDGMKLSDPLFLPPLLTPPALGELLKCVECLCCHAACPNLNTFDGDLKQFAGPYIFLKLAQLHLDPRDKIDRKAQSRVLGIEKCLDCKRCYCPQGIPLYKQAILPLLQ
jgi:fumarate reductase iron-sulfur subunit